MLKSGCDWEWLCGLCTVNNLYWLSCFTRQFQHSTVTTETHTHTSTTSSLWLCGSVLDVTSAAPTLNPLRKHMADLIAQSPTIITRGYICKHSLTSLWQTHCILVSDRNPVRGPMVTLSGVHGLICKSFNHWEVFLEEWKVPEWADFPDLCHLPVSISACSSYRKEDIYWSLAIYLFFLPFDNKIRQKTEVGVLWALTFDEMITTWGKRNLPWHHIVLSWIFLKQIVNDEGSKHSSFRLLKGNSLIWK